MLHTLGSQGKGIFFFPRQENPTLYCSLVFNLKRFCSFISSKENDPVGNICCAGSSTVLRAQMKQNSSEIFSVVYFFFFDPRQAWGFLYALWGQHWSRMLMLERGVSSCPAPMRLSWHQAGVFLHRAEGKQNPKACLDPLSQGEFPFMPHAWEAALKGFQALWELLLKGAIKMKNVIFSERPHLWLIHLH